MIKFGIFNVENGLIQINNQNLNIIHDIKIWWNLKENIVKFFLKNVSD